ncbi:MAG: ABC transporter substrate-binding protein [Mycobacteriales bacterium]
MATGRLSRRAFIGRLTALGVSATGIASVLAACDSSEPSRGPTGAADGQPPQGDLILYKGPFSPDDEAQVKQLLTNFTGEFPSVNVTQESFAWEAMAEQFPTRFLSNSPPDVNAVPDLEYAKWVNRRAFEDLTPYVTDPSWEQEFATIPEEIWDIARTADGKIYGIPWWGVVLSMLFVNRDLLDKAGVTDFNSSVDAFAAAVRQVSEISEISDDTFGFAMRTDQFNPAAFDWAAWPHTSGEPGS